MILAIGRELALQKSYLGAEKIHTIYFGGGTPSMLPAGELESLLEIIHSQFTIDPSAEITLEANPDDLDPGKLKVLLAFGINRLSIGIQTFDDGILKFLNRAHDATLALKSFGDARAAGFKNISIDLIYAIPGQELKAWKKNIAKAIELNPEHISAYSLTIEEKTVFGKWALQKKLIPPDNDVSAGELIALTGLLEDAGYLHYEVSNFSKAGYISRHNSNYWRGEKYLGVGPSAHSYNETCRQHNISNNHLYLRSIQSARVPAIVEVLSREDKINDWILTGLRTSWGTDLGRLRQELGYDLLQVHSRYVNALIEGDLAVVKDDALILTKSGRLLADRIASDLFAMAVPENDDGRHL